MLTITDAGTLPLCVWMSFGQRLILVSSLIVRRQINLLPCFGVSYPNPRLFILAVKWSGLQPHSDALKDFSSAWLTSIVQGWEA